MAATGVILSEEHITKAFLSVCELIVRGWLRPDSFWVLGPNFDSSFWCSISSIYSLLKYFSGIDSMEMKADLMWADSFFMKSLPRRQSHWAFQNTNL